jgi:hypothetical protein
VSDELETKDGEVLPNREVMSTISTDPTDAFLIPSPPSDEMTIQPYPHEPHEEELDPGPTRPVDEPPAA